MIFISLMRITLLIGIACAFLYLGFILLKKKPVIISSQLIIRIAGVTFLMIFVGIFLSRVVISLSSTWSSLLFLPIYGLILFSIKKSLGDLLLFNIEEKILYRSLTKTLRVKGISFDRWQNKINISSLDAEIVVKVHNQINAAIIYFNQKSKDDEKDINLAEEISADLKQMLSKINFDKFPVIGLICAIVGIFLLLVSLGMAFATVSRL